MIDGIRVFSNNVVEAGKYVVGDTSKMDLYTSGNVSIAIGYDSDDFTKNLVTIRAEVPACGFVKYNNKNAFVKGTFATDKAAINKS